MRKIDYKKDLKVDAATFGNSAAAKTLVKIMNEKKIPLVAWNKFNKLYITFTRRCMIVSYCDRRYVDKKEILFLLTDLFNIAKKEIDALDTYCRNNGLENYGITYMQNVLKTHYVKKYNAVKSVWK